MFLKTIVFCIACLFSLSVYAAPYKVANTGGGVVRNVSLTEAATVNVNKANEESLQTVKGIGPKRAQAIVSYRNKHGSFKTVADLAKVKGIGEKRLKKIAAHLTVK